MSDTKSAAAYPRLCIAYFLQFAIWGSWAIAVSGYATGVLGFSGTQVGWLYTAIPLGAIISPLFIGPIADRYFPAQVVIGVLHALSGVCLLIAGMTSSFAVLMTLLVLHGIFYMPTIALVNSVVFKHLPNPDNAPRVFVFGTIGWIFINIFIEVFCGGMNTANFFYVAGGASLLLAAYALTLPNTPPKGAEGGDALGLGALKLFKDRTFSIFVICAFLASVPACGLFFAVLGSMLGQRGYPAPLALGTLNQISEIFFMVLLPVFVTKFGLKRVLIIGMLAWAIRYLCFMYDPFSLALIGLILHGFCYSFLYVGAYMYGDKKAPEELKASVQSLLAFLLLGVGQVLGAQFAGVMLSANAPAITEMEVASAEEGKAGLPAWDDPNMADSAFRYLDLSGTVKGMFGGEVPEKHDLGTDVDKDKDNSISLAELKEAVSEDGLSLGGMTYTANELEKVFRQVAAFTQGVEGDGSDLDEADVVVTRADWLNAQKNGWKSIFLLPSIFIFVICGIFMVLGKDPDADGDDSASEAAEE